MADNMEAAPWWWLTAHSLAAWREQREQQGLSLEDLAVRRGLAPRTLEELEAGRVWHVLVGVLIRVVDALGHRLQFAPRTGGWNDEQG